MAFTINMTEFGSSGGFYGDGRVCTWNNWRAEAHSLVKHGPDGMTVVEEYPPQCMVGVDLYADRTPDDDDKFPQFVTQWYGVGQLPLAVMEAMGWPLARLQTSILAGPGGQDQWKRRLQQPGGFQPSPDGKVPGPSGPFFGSDPAEKIYPGSGYAVLKGELDNLANSGGEDLNDRVAAHGLAALNGLRAVAGQKQMPLSKASQKKIDAAAKLGVKADVKDPRSIMVPVQVEKWPWKAEAEPGAQPAPQAQTQAPVAAQVVNKPVAVPNAAPAQVATPAAASAANATADLDKLLAAVVVGLVSKAPGNSFTRSPAMGTAVLKSGKFSGPNLAAAARRIITDEFLGGEYNGLLWQFNQAANTVGLVDGVSADDAVSMAEGAVIA